MFSIEQCERLIMASVCFLHIHGNTEREKMYKRLIFKRRQKGYRPWLVMAKNAVNVPYGKCAVIALNAAHCKTFCSGWGKVNSAASFDFLKPHYIFPYWSHFCHYNRLLVKPKNLPSVHFRDRTDSRLKMCVSLLIFALYLKLLIKFILSICFFSARLQPSVSRCFSFSSVQN